MPTKGLITNSQEQQLTKIELQVDTDELQVPLSRCAMHGQ